MTGGDAPRRMIPRYESFPQDGALHWLRWLDGVDVRGHGSGRPAIHAHLSPLPDPGGNLRLPKMSEVAGSGAGHVGCAVPVASLPGLRLGAVFKDGVEVGSLAMARRTFAFDRPSCKDALVRCDDPNPAPKPEWWRFAWTVLPARAYALGQLRNGLCLLLRDRTRQLVIPASEVFRTFCAPEPALAEALLSGPWDDVRDHVVNPSWTEDLGDLWEIGLRTGLTRSSALPAAAFELSSYGRSVAGLVHASLVGPLARKVDLRAAIPYEWDAITLKVEGVEYPEEHGSRLGLDRFLCLRITGVEWRRPLRGLPPVIAYRLDNNNTTRRPDPPTPEEGGHPVPKASAPPSDDPSGTVPVNVAVPASAGVESLSVAASPLLAFVGGPLVERMVLVEPEGPPRPPRRTVTGDTVDHASPTRPGPGSGGAAPLRQVAGQGPSTSAFAELASALDALVDDRSIQEWSPTKPVNARWDVRDGFHAWFFPGHAGGRRIAWAYVAGTRRRTALVCRVAIGSRVLHLLEIERRVGAAGPSTEGFNMLLVEAPDDELEAVIASLFRIASGHRGVWPDDAAWRTFRDASGGGGIPISRRRHDYVGTGKQSPTQVTGQRLDDASLLRWMSRFLSANPSERADPPARA